MTAVRQLILASSSVYRADLLSRLGLPFTTLAPDVDESAQANESAPKLVRRLSESKARAVQQRQPGSCIIGSDQIALGDGAILGKPADVRDAERQLAALSGQTLSFYTGLCVLDGAGNCQLHVDETTVTFRTLDARAIKRYIQLERPLGCAGSFKSEGLGVCLFEKIVSEDPTALIGLPLIKTAQYLRAVGLDALA